MVSVIRLPPSKPRTAKGPTLHDLGLLVKLLTDALLPDLGDLGDVGLAAQVGAGEMVKASNDAHGETL